MCIRDSGYNNPNIPQFIGLCRIYGIKDAYKVFLQGDFSDLIYELNKEGADKLAEYKQLLIASGLYAPMSCKPKIIPFQRRTAPMYDIGASAGTGQFLDSNSYEMVEVPECVQMCIRDSKCAFLLLLLAWPMLPFASLLSVFIAIHARPPMAKV